MTTRLDKRILGGGITMALSRVACGSLARLVHSAALCTHTVLPFYTAGEPGLWPQLVLTAGTSVQQATLLASKVLFLRLHWVFRAVC